jgi:hypothetical protein
VGFPELLAVTYVGLLGFALAWNTTTAVGRALVMRFARQQHQEEAPSNPDVVVTLVHGTWARGAGWTASSSPLCATLRNAAWGTVRFERFTWSGRNAISARAAAIEGLISHIQATQERWPRARHYIVGHSHGGNIALQALRDRTVEGRTVGVVCLSTPFLCAAPRDLGPFGSVALWWGPVIVMLFCLALLVMAFVPESHVNTALCIALATSIWLGFLVERNVERLSEATIIALRYPVVAPTKVLIVRAPGDEASGALAAAYILSWLAGGLWSLTGRFLGSLLATVEAWRAELARYRLVSMVACAVLVGFLIAPGVFDRDKLFPWGDALAVLSMSSFVALLAIVAIYARGGLLVWFFGFLLISCLAAPFFLTVAILGMAIGPELLLAGLVLRVTAESTPPGGAWSVWQVPRDPFDGRHNTDSLMHSACYQNEEALEVVARWFSEIDGRATRNSPERADYPMPQEWSEVHCLSTKTDGADVV